MPVCVSSAGHVRMGLLAAAASARYAVSLFAVAVLVLGLDQLSKGWVRANLLPGQAIPADGPFRITHVTNTGGAFGLFQDQSALLGLVAGVVIVLILLYHRTLSEGAPWLRLSLGLQLGGAIGNLADRVRLGHVTDFLDFRVWPVFNLADSAIVVGVLILSYYVVFGERRASRSRKPS